MRQYEDLKVLVLHPFLNFYGGAEYMLGVVVNELFPKSDIMVLSYSRAILRQMNIEESRVKSLLGTGLFSKLYRQMTPFYPSLIDNVEINNYDLVISLSYAYVHGVVTDHLTPHISIVHTPMRLLWCGESAYYAYDKIPLVKEIYHLILSSQRLWDSQAAMRPDYLIANSKEVSERIKKIWNRKSEVVYPPVDIEFYKPPEKVIKEDYYITHCRLVRLKRVDLIIQTFKKINKKLKIIGSGPELKKLKKLAGNSPFIEFIGYSTHEQKREYLHKARGFIFAAHEDFGIAPVEAMAAGLPVLAYNNGGAKETVTNKTGVFFNEQTVDSLISGFKIFEKFIKTHKVIDSLSQAEKFSKEQFKNTFIKHVKMKLDDFKKNGPPVIL